MDEFIGGGLGTVDLHIHTRFSDGAFTVEQILDMAESRGLSAISITDHDTLGAYPFAIEEGAKRGIEVIPGAELSCELEGNDIHILGYFLDYENEKLKSVLEDMREARYHRAKKIVENLNEQGIDLRFETVLRFAAGGALGRPHIANALLHEELVYSFKEAFDSFLGYNSPAYVEKLQMTPKEVFDLIKGAGGIPILAHPGVTQVDDLIPQLVEFGLAGLEVYHSDHSSTVRRHYSELCRRNKLLFTGGSDFHCHTHRPHQVEVGDPSIRYSLLQGLKKRYKEFI
jgi:predicted metal-dependent phosphoesterase TrpH